MIQDKKQLEERIQKAALASHFERTDVGQFVIEWMAGEITRITNEVMTNKSENEQFDKGKAAMARKFLGMLQVTKENGKTAAKQLDAQNG